MNFLRKIAAVFAAAALLCSSLAVNAAAKSDELSCKVSYKTKYTLVTLTPTSEKNSIRFTTDGSKPDVDSELYEDGVKLYSAATLRAAEFNSSGKKVSTLKVSVKRKCAKVTLAAEKTKSGFDVALDCSTDDCTIYYTTDGSKPTTDSLRYDGVFSVKKGAKVRALAVKKNWKNSPIASFTVKKAVGKMPADNSEAAVKADELTEKIFELVNEYRDENGLNALSLDATLCNAAKQRAEEIAGDYSIHHSRPDGRKWYTVLEEYGFVYCFAAENIAFTEGVKNNAEYVMDMWIDSKVHRDNILNEGGSLIGIGWVKKGNYVYWVQLFGERM